VLADGCGTRKIVSRQAIVDLATLTGAIIAALSDHYAGLSPTK